MDALPESAEAPKKTAPVARIDVACVRDRTLLVYGWVLGLASEIANATVTVDTLTVNLADAGLLVARPDVTANFAGALVGGDDYHGFYLFADLPARALAETLHLSLTASDGGTSETDWPIVSDAEALATAVDRFSTTFTTLSRKLPVREQRRLSRFCRSDFSLDQMLPPSVKAGVETCCLVEGRFLFVYGWLQDPHELVTDLKFCAGDRSFNLQQLAQIIPSPVGRSGRAEPEAVSRRGFALGVPLNDRHLDHAEFGLQIDCGDGAIFLWTPAVLDPVRARAKLSEFLEQTDANTAILIINGLRDRTVGVAIPPSFETWLARQHRAAVMRLPNTLRDPILGVDIHIDAAIRVGPAGLFLIGWLNSDPLRPPQIRCVCGADSLDVAANWLNHRRPDVLRHLAQEGSTTAEYSSGFACFVPLSDGDAAYYLEISVPGAEIWRVRLDVPARAAFAIDTVRSILMSFDAGDWEIGELLDRHVGQAVKAAWETRGIVGKSFVQTFGNQPPEPEVSVIIPLFGRYDLAEYQLALFADDPALSANELIYVVDDPAIFDAFRLLCPALYATYGVPFVLAYPGGNLGFSGANNYAAGLARGPLLLLMNSDVFPKTANFLPEMTRIYQSQPDPGVLGVKLLFEDGSLQHAGMEFRRNAGWANMWINHHPLKGHNPAGLAGVADVPAVTAACAMIDARLYRSVGGLTEDYILGDFEDSDLCLKVRQAGGGNRIAYDIALYHLERQSQNRIGDGRWRTNLTLYNCWVHDRRWGSFIAELSA